MNIKYFSPAPQTPITGLSCKPEIQCLALDRLGFHAAALIIRVGTQLTRTWHDPACRVQGMFWPGLSKPQTCQILGVYFRVGMSTKTIPEVPFYTIPQNPYSN